MGGGGHNNYLVRRLAWGGGWRLLQRQHLFLEFKFEKYYFVCIVLFHKYQDRCYIVIYSK